ncbi:MAG: response regulator [Verrucomicrobiales bacterium]|nr:response regulator [Verrucomicrobiales bacterium]
MNSESSSPAPELYIVPDEAPEKAGGPSAGRVLFSDDDETNRTLLKIAMEMEGFEVVTTENGREGLDVLRNEGRAAFDVLLVDLMMPEVDGVTMIREARKSLGYSNPIIVYSGVDREETIQKAIDAGADRILNKPVGLADLVSELKQIMKASAAAR